MYLELVRFAAIQTNKG